MRQMAMGTILDSPFSSHQLCVPYPTWHGCREKEYSNNTRLMPQQISGDVSVCPFMKVLEERKKIKHQNYIIAPRVEIWESKLILSLILSILFILFILWLNIQGKFNPLCNKQT